MNIKEKLQLMDEISEDNKRHVEEWKQENLKSWVADYGFIDKDGNKHDEKGDPAFPFGTNRIKVHASNIQDALIQATQCLTAIRAGQPDWQDARIYDIGIMDDNIW